MKTRLFLAGTLWMLLSGLVSLPAPPVPIQPPRISAPRLESTPESASPKKTQVPSFLSQLEQSWQTDRLLAVSA